MSTSDNELARLLEQARKADLPDRARLDRVRERLLPTAAGGAGARAPQPSRVLNGKSLGLAAKLSVGLGVAILAVGGATLLPRHAPPPSAATSAAGHTSSPALPVPGGEPRPPQVADVAGSTAAAPASEPSEGHRKVSESSEVHRKAARAHVRPTAKSADVDPRPSQPGPSELSAPARGDADTDTDTDADTEAALLRKTVLYLRNGNVEQARSALAAARRRFPQSQLLAEHERLARWLARLEQQNPLPPP